MRRFALKGGICWVLLFPQGCSSFTTFSLLANPRRARQNSFAPLGLSTTNTRALEKLTIKELKELLKRNHLTQPGWSSKLKRKEDLVNYLQQHLPASVENDENSSSLRQGGTSDKEVWSSFPPALRDKLERRGISELLPIQVASFPLIASGTDVVLQAPTGSGKTFAFCWPLCARILQDSKLLCYRHKGKQHGAERHVAVSPRLLVLVPSRELARQVGKEFQKFTDAPVATVYGGVPLERHSRLLRMNGGAHICVATPGRWRELVREGMVDYNHLGVVVLDEADRLLDVSDSPDVKAILENINDAVGQREDYKDQEYQMVLVSATVNDIVRKFAKETMDVTQTSPQFVSMETVSMQVESHHREASSVVRPAVQHWYTPVKTTAQPFVTMDLVTSLAPKLCLVFVATKSDTEMVADLLQQRLKAKVRTLHGDMSQPQRSRTITLLRESSPTKGQILVATDVASRGLDLPNVDLVIQFGIPRVAGKEGTYSVELYTHRTGRAGRVGMSKTAHTVLFFDPAMGEGRVLDDLVGDVKKTLGRTIQYRPMPSCQEIVESAYQRSFDAVFRVNNAVNPELVSYFRNRLEEEEKPQDVSDKTDLLEKLSRAMALLTELDPNISPSEPNGSLLTGDRNDRTLAVYREDGSMTPPEVTKFCKSYHSGKLGRMIISNGAALFDLPTRRAKRLLENVAAAVDTNGWKVEFAKEVPDWR